MQTHVLHLKAQSWFSRAQIWRTESCFQMELWMPGVASVNLSETECSRHRLGKCLLLPTTTLPGHTEPKSLAFTGGWDNIVKPTEKGKSKYALTLCLPINTQMFKSKRNKPGAWSRISVTAKGICLLMPHGLHLSSFIHCLVVLITCPRLPYWHPADFCRF